MTAALIVGAFLFLSLASFFAAGEAALTKFDRERLEALSRDDEEQREGSANLSNREELLLAANVARLIFSVLFFVVMLSIWKSFFAELPNAISYLVAIFISTFLILLLISESASKSYARANAEHTLIRVLPTLRATAVILAPALWLLRMINLSLGKLFDVTMEVSTSHEVAEEVLSFAEEGEQSGLLQEEQKQMIEGIISLPDADVRDIMTPRTDMVALPETTSMREAYDVFVNEGFSRIPVYQETLDNILGILYAKDLLKIHDEHRDEAMSLTSLMRKPYFVPETKLVSELLHEMRNHKIHMAIILDEYGGTAGLVTNEDIIEEIVGEIEDEFDTETAPPIRQIDEHTIEVDASTHINEVNEALEIELPESEDYESVGGFLLYQMGLIPSANQSLEHEGIRFTVLEASSRRILRLRVEVQPEITPSPD